DRGRPLPRLAGQTFTEWFRRHTPPATAPRGEVVLFNDTFTTYNVPEIARAAVEVLEAGGYRVVLVERKCCGRPLISKGMLAEAREHAAWNVARLAPYARRGVAIVGLEPSSLLMLRDGRLVRLRARALRHLGHARQSPPRAGREGRAPRDRDRRIRHLLPPADPAPGGSPGQASGRGPERGALALSLAAAAAVLVAALVKGAIGFGFPTLGTPLLALVVDVKTAVALLVIPNLVMDGIQLRRQGPLGDAPRRLAPLLVFTMLGTVIGT